MLLTAAIAITASFAVPDARLESFSLQVQPQPPSVEAEDEPSWPWRITGWASYLACGSIPLSTAYRQDRSGWEPNGPNQPALQAAIFGGFAMSTNVLSDRVRKNQKRSDAAWATRLTSLGSCVAISGMNFRKGWLRE